MATVLITGGNRGIGLEFVRQYLAGGDQVIATARSVSTCAKLQELGQGKNAGRLTILPLEVTDPQSRTDFLKRLGQQAIDLFINNAGIYGPKSMPLGEVDEQEWIKVLQVNTIAPLKLAELLRGNLSRGQRPVIAILSSKMGSMADNTSGGSYIYRSSKAAVNAVTKSLAVDLADDGISVVALHPGWVQTDMGGPNALIDVATSVSGMKNVLDALDPSLTGHFINYDGATIPW